MSSQSKIIKDIFSIYDTILENKLNEVDDVYRNIDFVDSGSHQPSNDDIDTELLRDIQNAANNAGVTVSITTAVSGHKKTTSSGNPSRHPVGNAVDIAIINGKNVSLSNRADADKFVNALVSMGYVKNVENSSTPKSVLTFGFSGHDDHVHVSNNSDDSSTNDDETQTSGTSGSSGSSGSSGTNNSDFSLSTEIETDPMVRGWGDAISQALHLDKLVGENVKRIKGLLK